MTELEGEGIGFQSVTEAIDTTTPGGKLVFHIFGALAEFERNLIRERTKAGLEAARARGRKGGRRKKLGEKQRKLAVDLYRQKKHPHRRNLPHGRHHQADALCVCAGSWRLNDAADASRRSQIEPVDGQIEIVGVIAADPMQQSARRLRVPLER